MDRYANEKTTEVPHSNGANVRIVMRKPRRYPRQPFMTYTATAADARNAMMSTATAFRTAYTPRGSGPMVHQTSAVNAAIPSTTSTNGAPGSW